MEFADKLEKATIDTIEGGKMTKDLALITTLENPTVLNSEGFIKAIFGFPSKKHALKRSAKRLLSLQKFLRIVSGVILVFTFVI